MSSRPPKAPGPPLSPEDVRGALRELGREGSHEAAEARAFAAKLHLRLADAGEPPGLGWLARLRDGLARSRPILTGAVLGALVTATAFMLLSAGRPDRDAETTVERTAAAPAAPLDGRAVLRPPSGAGRGGRTMRTLGDRHVTRDRMGDDIGAERPERSRARFERR